jgi:hypothetical protein
MRNSNLRNYNRQPPTPPTSDFLHFDPPGILAAAANMTFSCWPTRSCIESNNHPPRPASATHVLIQKRLPCPDCSLFHSELCIPNSALRTPHCPMLEFRPRIPARNYLARREQWRLLAWVMGIGLLILAGLRFDEILKLIRAQPEAVAPNVDTRFHPSPQGTSEPDSVTMVAAEESIAPGDGRAQGGVNDALLRKVRDDTPWIRNDEIDAWLNLWSVLGRSSDAQIAADSVGEVGFVELFGQPQAYRGKLVTMRGAARQAEYLKAAKNDAGVEGYYRVVLQPQRGPDEPVFVYALQLPEGFPVGEKIRAEIAATGYFFKRMVYTTRDEADLRRAPVIMARTLNWQQPSTVIPEQNGRLVSVLMGVTGIGILAFFALSYWASQRGLSAKARRSATLAPIDDRNVVDVNESLARLAEKLE